MLIQRKKISFLRNRLGYEIMISTDPVPHQYNNYDHNYHSSITFALYILKPPNLNFLLKLPHVPSLDTIHFIVEESLEKKGKKRVGA